MLCFAFLDPQSIRLLLDRTKYDGYVLPSAADSKGKLTSSYEDIVSGEHRRVPVFIHQDIPSLLLVLRSGKLRRDVGKHVLCASLTVLTENMLEPLDKNSNAAWRVRNTIGATLNRTITTDGDIDEETENRLCARIKASTTDPKVSVPAVVVSSTSSLESMLGASTADKSLVRAILKYLIYGYVSEAAAALGSTPADITAAARHKLSALNTRVFVAWLRENKIKVSRETLMQAKDVLVAGGVSRTLLHYCWRRLLAKRPFDLAVADTGCSARLASLVDRCGLTIDDFPKPNVQTTLTKAAPDPKSSCTTHIVPDGVYSFTQLLRILGETVGHALEILGNTTSKIMFSRNPVWLNNDNHWRITDTPLAMLYKGAKHRFVSASYHQKAKVAAVQTVPVKSAAVSRPTGAKLSALAPLPRVRKPAAVAKPVLPAQPARAVAQPARAVAKVVPKTSTKTVALVSKTAKGTLEKKPATSKKAAVPATRLKKRG